MKVHFDLCVAFHIERNSGSEVYFLFCVFNKQKNCRHNLKYFIHWSLTKRFDFLVKVLFHSSDHEIDSLSYMQLSVNRMFCEACLLTRVPYRTHVFSHACILHVKGHSFRYKQKIKVFYPKGQDCFRTLLKAKKEKYC